MFAFLIFVFTVLSLTHGENIASSPLYQEVNYCLLPSYPEHGRYTVRNYPYATPGEIYSSVKLDISCETGYLNNSTVKGIFCVNGEWSASMPTCAVDLNGYCTVPTGDLRVEYRCLSFPGTLERSWECESIVSRNTIVRPICRFPGYFSRKVLSDMHCKDGMWDYNPICKRACGETTQHRQLEGKSTKHLELPWNAVIYAKESPDFKAICTGSLITDTKIISAAACFHDTEVKLIPASICKVAVNKMYISYNDTRDINTQYSDVDELIIPSSYQGRATYFEDDIAIVVVKRDFLFHLSVRPVCLDFDSDLDSTQLAEGNSGKTASWSRDVINSQSSYVLNVFDISYLKNEDCNTLLETDFSRQFLTKDRFCARLSDGTWSDYIYAGGGLALLESTTQRYYLRGVYIGSFTGTDGRHIYFYTSIVKHERFIKEHF